MKEILKHLVATTTLPEDRYLEQDAEILGIFVEELEEIFAELETVFADWWVQPHDTETLTTIRRHFHTLKGSGRMVGANSASETAWLVEDTLNRVISGSIRLTPMIQRYAQMVLNIYQYKLYPCFKQRLETALDLRPVVLLGQQLQAQQSPEPALEVLLDLASSLNHTSSMTGLELDTDWVNTAVTSQTVIESLESEDTITAIDPALVIDERAAQDVSADVVETVAIFIEEAEDHLETIDCFIRNEQRRDYNALIRAVHTLRGSSSMAHIEQIFEASSKVESLYKALLQEDVESTSKEIALLIQYAEFVRDYLHVLRQDGSDQLDQITATFQQVWENYGFSSDSLLQDVHPEGLVTQLVGLNIETLLDAEFKFETSARMPEYLLRLSDEAARLLKHTDNRAAQGIHQFTLELKAAYDALLEKPNLLHQPDAYELFAQVHQQLIHFFDTLAVGERVILSEESLGLLSDLAAFVQQDIEDFTAEDIALEGVVSATECLELATTIEAQTEELQVYASGSTAGMIDVSGLSRQIAADQSRKQDKLANRKFDPELLDIFLEEADELLAGIDHDLNTWSGELSNAQPLNNLMRYLHTLKGGANMIQATNIGLLAHELESVYERIIRQQLEATPQLIQIIRLVQDNVSDRIQTIRDEGVDYPAGEGAYILQNIQTLAADTAEEPIQEQRIAEPVEDPDSTLRDEAELQAIMAESFLEEAEETLGNAQQALTKWFEHRGDRSLLLQLQRAAHSIKGAARMLKNEMVASIAYKLETTFEQFAVHHFNSNAYDGLLMTTLSWLRMAIFQQNYENFTSLTANLDAIAYLNVSTQLPTRVAQVELNTTVKTLELVQGDGSEPPSMLGEWVDSHQADNSNEMIRISADLVEKMIDLAGENAINRSRIEMDLGQLGSTLNEMELAIKRLADQLRRMEGELESQILAKHSSDHSRYADFDPLEMDQYSSLNQLSKSLAESASDLVDFKSTLAEKIRDTEGLLLQQSRIQAEIQESLMRTRLVPFSRLLPRLQRIVRQTAGSLNRAAELVVQNTEGELDRTILERLVSPLEHMLRNAIDHGLEDPEQRIQLGKAKVGQITLNISRQGTDVLVSFSDDGKGIDASKIKERALQQGLITADQVLDKQAILQLIFHPGLSTATAVTQISGRGVGLDVVMSEIKALGGHVTVESTVGKGTRFMIRVPTTVAVSDALMVKSGDQQFALSLAQIDRIVRVAPSALEQYFNSNEDHFKIDHEKYQLRYLSEFIGHNPVPRLMNAGQSLPVLLIKGNAGQSIALLVDQLVGSRAQIVVKPVGQQFASIAAITGATILGDGQVCLILDGQSIARQIQTTPRMKHAIEPQGSGRQNNVRRLVMIVDDSVTVRKVTSRLLERQGYDVVTAKDGIDALEQLENIRPDLMLLDIEMPRMDGFEVTNLLRHHDIHRELPIMMITSRTGEKHRERAFSLGVTHYMGKPFQEAELLENIKSIIVERQG